MNTADTSTPAYSIGETLVQYLDQQGVELVFGIPGVHTVELYRGLAASGIRHITPRHEQGAGFMADGYARVSGKPGVAFVITGPGITNILTPMAQSLADSVSVLVVSSVNADQYLGKGLGHLHELPDQQGLCSLVALRSEHISEDSELMPALQGIFAEFANGTPGPRHVQIPLDVMGKQYWHSTKNQRPTESSPSPSPTLTATKGGRETSIYHTPADKPERAEIQKAQTLLASARHPIILSGGGSLNAEAEIIRLAEALDAPVVQTINARGLMHGHTLKVPASPSLNAVRTELEAADVVLALGTQLGPTDYDIYYTGAGPQLAKLIRIDINPQQLARHPATVSLCGDAQALAQALLDGLDGLDVQAKPAANRGSHKAAAINSAALAELSPDYQHMISMLEAIRDTLPASIIVGDSTQPMYAANMYYDHDHPRGWFNAATGYGALGYAIPAAIGAQLAAPDSTVICISGDGGAQFTQPELMVAVDEQLPVIFIIWNNRGYQEIETSMAAANVEVVGCDPTPPDFKALAAANRMPYLSSANTPAALATTLRTHKRADGPVLLEIVA